MADIALLDIAERLQIKAPEAPLPHIVNCLRFGARAFCKESEAYLFRIDPISTRVGVVEYEIDQPRGTEVMDKLTRLLFHGKPLKASSEHLLDTDLPGWETDHGVPQYYFIRDRILYIARAPSSSERAAITGVVQLRVAKDASAIDEDFFEKHEQAIFDYTLSQLYDTKGAPWGDTGMADRHLMRGMAAAEDAKYESRQLNTNKSRLMSYGG